MNLAMMDFPMERVQTQLLKSCGSAPMPELMKVRWAASLAESRFPLHGVHVADVVLREYDCVAKRVRC